MNTASLKQTLILFFLLFNFYLLTICTLFCSCFVLLNIIKMLIFVVFLSLHIFSLSRSQYYFLRFFWRFYLFIISFLGLIILFWYVLYFVICCLFCFVATYFYYLCNVFIFMFFHEFIFSNHDHGKFCFLFNHVHAFNILLYF